MSYHKDTFEVLTREVYNARVCHPTDIYLDRLWHTLDRYRPDIDAFVAALERAIEKCAGVQFIFLPDEKKLETGYHSKD